MSQSMRVCIETTRPLTASEKGVLAVVIANVVETRQATTSAALSVVCLSDFREWSSSFTARRVHELLASIVEVQWRVDADSLRQPMPIFWNVLDKGSAFVVEVDSRFFAQREAEKFDPTHQLPELIGRTEADATAALNERGLAVRIETRDGRSPSTFQSADIRRDRANLKIEHGIVVRAFLG